MEILLQKLQGVPRKGAPHALSAPSAVFCKWEILECEGTCEGISVPNPRDGGFGYDPIFMVGERSFANFPGGKGFHHHRECAAELERS
jgi:XTP/dITP diphosphohydrolase